MTRNVSAGARESQFVAFGQELAAAVRGLLRSPLYSVPALASLALGIGASTAVFAIFSAMVLRPLPFPDEAQLVQPGLTGLGPSGTGEMSTLSPAFAADFRELSSVFQSFSLRQSNAARLTGTESPQRIALELVSPNFFDTLAVRPVLGRAFSAEGPAPDGPDVVVLRYGYWQETLGGAAVVGKTLLVDDQPKLVLGIVSDEQALPSYAEMWMPNQFPTQGRFSFFLTGVARLAPGLSLEAARERLTALTVASQVHTPRGGGLITGTLTSLRDTLVNPQRNSLALMLAAVFTFLLLACSNVAALLATRASLRQREHAVRSALGATRAVLLRQSALEACLLSLAGGALGLALAQLGMRLANDEYHDVLANMPVRLDPRVTATFLALLLLSALTATLAPALHARRVGAMDALRADGRSSQGRGERRVREGLVALQVAASLALLVNAGLLVRSVRALLAVDLGFSTSGVVAAAVHAPLPTLAHAAEFQMRAGPLPDAEQQRVIEARAAQALATVQSVYQRVQQLPGVEAACVAGELPFDWFSNSLMMEPEKASGRATQPALPHHMSPGCLATLGIRLLSGRDLTPSDGSNPESTPVALVNQEFARTLLGVENAVGHRFRQARPPDFPGPKAPWFEIVGMVGNALEYDVTAARSPAVYFPFFGDPLALSNPSGLTFAVAVKTSGSVEPLLGTLPKAIGEVTRDAPVFIVQSLSDRVERSFSDCSALERILSVFGLCAVILAAIGLFGVTAYSVTERSSEIGIRRALGASRGAIVRMILGETALVVLAGMVLGAGLCWLGRDLLAAFLFGVAASDAVTYLCVGLGIVVIALSAALVASRAASTISPSRALAER